MNGETKFLFSLIEDGHSPEEIEAVAATLMDSDGRRLDMRSATVQRALLQVPGVWDALVAGANDILDSREGRHVQKVEIVNASEVARKK